MSKTIIHLGAGPIFEVLGHDGEHWGKGWGDYEAPQVTKTCLHGAIRRCVPVKGDAYILETVGSRFGFGVVFNDSAIGWASIRARIEQGFDITDDMLEKTFGANWKVIVSVVRMTAVATGAQLGLLDKAYKAVNNATRLNAELIGNGAVRRAAAAGGDAFGLVLKVANAGKTAWASALDAGRAAGVATGVAHVAAGSAWDAAYPFAAHDLIGQHGFIQNHYDTLTCPWIAVFGDPFEHVPEA